MTKTAIAAARVAKQFRGRFHRGHASRLATDPLHPLRQCHGRVPAADHDDPTSEPLDLDWRRILGEG